MSNKNNLSPLEKAAIGAFASVIANTVVYPLDITKTLIQTQHNISHMSEKEVSENPKLYKSTVDALQKIFKEHGLKGLYFGIIPSLASTAASNFTYFFWYALVHKMWDSKFPNKVKSTAAQLVLGAVAGALSQLIIMPISTVSTKQQTELSDEENKAAPTFLQTAQKIVANDGISGLWSGLKVSLVLTANPSITYGTFERLRAILYSTKNNLSALQSFTLGVMSKLLATVITQPLIVSKVMIQKKNTIVTEKVTDPKTGEVKYVKTKRQFKSFQECLVHLFESHGFFGLWKGLVPQISKAVIVQGFLFMFKEELEVVFISMLRIIKRKRLGALAKA